MNQFEEKKKNVSYLIQQIKGASHKVATKAKYIMKDQSGQLLVDHAGWVAVILVIIGLFIYLSYPWLKNTVWPAIQTKIMGLINYSG